MSDLLQLVSAGMLLVAFVVGYVVGHVLRGARDDWRASSPYVIGRDVLLPRAVAIPTAHRRRHSDVWPRN